MLCLHFVDKRIRDFQCKYYFMYYDDIMEGLVNKLQNVLTNESELLIIVCESVIIYIEDPLYPFNGF